MPKDSEMFIEITFDDGTFEKVSVELTGNVVSSGGGWIPGHLVATPSRCHYGSDFFGTALDEGRERVGRVQPEEADIDPDTGRPDWCGFSWRLLGDERVVSASKMKAWIDRLGSDFDPYKSAEEYLVGGLLRKLDLDEARTYESDKQCWIYYLDDPEIIAAQITDAREEESSTSTCKP